MTLFSIFTQHVGAHGGCTRAEHATVAREAIVKLKDSLTWKIVSPVLSVNQQIATFDPEKMKDLLNFFNFMLSWCESQQAMTSHFELNCLGNVFSVVAIINAQAVNPGGTLQVDANGDLAMQDEVHCHGSVIDPWHTFTLCQATDFCEIHCHHAEDVDHQNLTWL